MLGTLCLLLPYIPMSMEALFIIREVECGPAIVNALRNKFIRKNLPLAAFDRLLM